MRILDDYLDGACPYKEAYSELDSLSIRMSYAFDFTPGEMTAEQEADFDIKLYIVLAWNAVSKDGRGGSPETYREVIEYRNKLAALAGLKSR